MTELESLRNDVHLLQQEIRELSKLLSGDALRLESNEHRILVSASSGITFEDKASGSAISVSISKGDACIEVMNGKGVRICRVGACADYPAILLYDGDGSVRMELSVQEDWSTLGLLDRARNYRVYAYVVDDRADFTVTKGPSEQK